MNNLPLLSVMPTKEASQGVTAFKVRKRIAAVMKFKVPQIPPSSGDKKNEKTDE